ncbi:hypothetical protein RN001_004765 [Aquatica leii]|uniref:Choline O-acetyltransferase n=1 Tax=Aquatica leii TaxID=1421715 RepID=A0AAN7SA86_9COLE|nr:hypothetical protein RN001_004765 [Aquatica leii]
MYLTSKFPLPIYSSPAFIRKINTVVDVCHVGAQIVCAAVTINWLIKHDVYPKEDTLKKTPTVQLCMEQYNGFFQVCRIVGRDKDSVKTFNHHNNNHIIVIYRNDFYYVPIKMSEEGIDKKSLYYCLKAIKNNIKTSKSLSVGILTTLERRKWWKIKNILMKNSTNKHSISLIESAFLILCLDEPIKTNLENTNEDKNTLLQLQQSLHGGGSNQNSGNRWYDKTVQIILSESITGYCFEHSTLDGKVSNAIIQSLFNTALKTVKINCSNCNQNKIQPVKLKWVLKNNILQSINNASVKFDKLVNDLDMQMYTHEKYGSEFIKSLKCSPDAYVQLLLQLAYFKLNNKLCSTYESCSTRKFKRGRLDCIRATTTEVFEWVKEMIKVEVDNSVKLKLWKNAVNAQVKESRDVAMGHGIDIHLLGLREAAKEVLDIVPELFTDKSYSIANNFILSTSQIGDLENAYCVFGPVIDNGYGVYYSIYPNCILIIVTSFYSCQTTSTQDFLAKLKESFDDVKKMIENVS